MAERALLPAPATGRRADQTVGATSVEGYAPLQARSLDRQARAALRPGAIFRVHSVFDRALNLRLADGLLLGLVGPGGGNGPATVVLSDLPVGGFTALVRIGQEARVAQPALLAVGPALTVDLARVTLWKPPEPKLPLALDLVRANLAQAADLAWQARGTDGLGGLLPSLERLTEPRAGPPLAASAPLLRLAGPASRALLAAWRAGDTSAAGQAAALLIGLGPGQTPAGDDLLAGLFAARLRARPGDRREAALVTACLAATPGRTTDLALARLRFAAQGELDERSLEALAALTDDDPPRLERSIRALLGFGHSSGLDTLVGLLLGLRLECGTARPEQASSR